MRYGTLCGVPYTLTGVRAMTSYNKMKSYITTGDLTREQLIELGTLIRRRVGQAAADLIESKADEQQPGASPASEQPKVKEDHAQLFYNIMADALRNIIKYRCMPFDVYVKNDARRSSLRKCEEDVRWFAQEAYAEQPLPRDVLVWFYKQYFAMTIDHLRMNTEAPISPRVLLAHGARFASLFDRAYPGYSAHSDLVRMVIRTARRAGSS
jgi:hypothetical protein